MEDYPKTLDELERRFATEESCREYLHQLRWPDGYRCPRCNHGKCWLLSEDLLGCASCGYKTSITAGTVFERTRKPLVLWFRVAWWVTSQKNGASAKGLQRVLGFGGYETAWTWLHKLRRAMVRPDRDRLSGTVEIDETFIGGEKPGKRGRGAAGKSLVLIAVELDGKRLGRVRLRRIDDASAESLIAGISYAVEPGSIIRTDGWSGYAGMATKGYTHTIVRSQGEIGENLLPGCHRIASLLKRWLMGTHQGAVSHEHLDYYLDEYTFRFNRRTSRHRGKLFFRLLENAMVTPAKTYDQIARGIRGPKPNEHKG